MKRIVLATAAVLALTACADTATLSRRAPEDATPLRHHLFLPQDSLYTTQTPAAELDASPGWEVSTEFTPYYDGNVVGFRFYKASGETGTHTARLFNSLGVEVANGTFAGETASGWQRVTIPAVYVYANETYVVSVNTNVKQAKTFAYFTNNGPITRNWGSAGYAYYGQPTGSLPTSGSGSSYFVDVYFRALGCHNGTVENCT